MNKVYFSRRGRLFSKYERAVLAYRAAVHTMAESRGSEFKKARDRAEKLQEECQAARDALRRCVV